LAIGPPTDEGFFYEMGMTGDRFVSVVNAQRMGD
jgi:hypothetical protein